MHQNQHEIIVLKPTEVFLSFLASQLPDIKLPDIRLLQIDNTAYVLQKQNSNEAILDEIEKHFATMFHHEMYRWLGDQVHNELEINFIDFLCCFKFELHEHIVLMETSMEKSHQLLLIRPCLALLNWLNAPIEAQGDLMDVIEKVDLARLEEKTVALVKNFSNLTVIKPFIKEYYQTIFSTAMNLISSQSAQWPLVDSLQTFRQYFAIEIHTQLICLSHLRSSSAT